MGFLGRLKRAIKAFSSEWQAPTEEQTPELTPIYEVGDYGVVRMAPWWYVYRMSDATIIDFYALSRTAKEKADELAVRSGKWRHCS